MKKKIIAIFGGSFNPPINSHLILAKKILEKNSNIEKIIYVPVSTKYRKEGLEDDKNRVNMLKIMCMKEPKLEVSTVEIDSKKQLYTIETLDYFKKLYKEHSIYFIMGTDNLKELEAWHTPEKILKNYKIIVLEREEDSLETIIESSNFLKNNKKSIIKIDGIDKIDLSSTMIREKIKKGEDIKEFINKDVLKYIKENKLYL